MIAQYGDSAWLRSRIAIIAFEECWPSASLLSNTLPLDVLPILAKVEKNKDACGLGSLALAYSEGNLEILNVVNHDVLAVKIVAAAIRRPEDFFEWAFKQCVTQNQHDIISMAKQFISSASWAWDKAFMISGAYLVLQSDITPELLQCPSDSPLEKFPFWVAVDKHTPQGKTALRKVSTILQVKPVQLEWCSFYLESAKTQALQECAWWNCETIWRFSTVGLNLQIAQELWAEAAPLVELEVKQSVSSLREILDLTIHD